MKNKKLFEKKLNVLEDSELDHEKNILFLYNKKNVQTAKEIGIRLKIIRQLTGLTLEEFGEKYKLTASMAGRYERGETPLKQAAAWSILSQLFVEDCIYVSMNWLLAGVGNAPAMIKNKSVYLESLVSSKESYHVKILAITQIINSTDKKNVSCTIRDGTMGTMFQKGAIVSGKKIDLNNKKDLNGINNEYCIIETIKGKRAVRAITYHNDQEIFSCVSVNPMKVTIIPFPEVKYCAPIFMILNNQQKDDIKSEKITARQKISSKINIKNTDNFFDDKHNIPLQENHILGDNKNYFDEEEQAI